MATVAQTPTTTVRGLTDTALLDYGRSAAAELRAAQAKIAAFAGEVARRSDPTLGKDGLARGAGYRTPEALVQEITGSTKHTAVRDVAVGRVLNEPEPDAADASTWLTPVRDAVLTGAISTDHAAAITHELGTPDADVTAEVLEAAATELVSVAGTVHADRVRAIARDLRNDLDLDRVQERETLLRQKRSLRVFRQDDGTSKLIWVMDPDTAAVVTSIVDRATSPRLGGPRFIDTERTDAASRIIADPRTTEQLASDVIRDLLAAAAALDTDRAEHLLLQVEQPAVKILVTEDTLTSGTGAGYLEGTGAEVSIPTIERARCTGTTQTLTFSPGGTPLDVGRTKRLFTQQQREILAATWGGCAIPWCDRPPTWCEHHHIQPWADGGTTSTDNGILLCRCHHQDLHNNAWEIQHTDTGLLLHTPTGTTPSHSSPSPAPGNDSAHEPPEELRQ